jgi:hypothetical protein
MALSKSLQMKALYFTTFTCMALLFQNCAPAEDSQSKAMAGPSVSSPNSPDNSQVSTSTTPGAASSSNGAINDDSVPTTTWHFQDQIGPTASGQHFGIEPALYYEMLGRNMPEVGQSCEPHLLQRSYHWGSLYEDISQCSANDKSCASASSGAICCSQVRDYSCY